MRGATVACACLSDALLRVGSRRPPRHQMRAANASTAIGSHKQHNENQINQIIKKETLYCGDHDLGNGSNNIEMLLSQNNDLVISAQHLSLPDSFIIEIEANKVEHLISEF